jgi:hypothetical protein
LPAPARKSGSQRTPAFPTVVGLPATDRDALCESTPIMTCSARCHGPAPNGLSSQAIRWARVTSRISSGRSTPANAVKSRTPEAVSSAGCGGCRGSQTTLAPGASRPSPGTRPGSSACLLLPRRSPGNPRFLGYTRQAAIKPSSWNCRVS